MVKNNQTMNDKTLVGLTCKDKARHVTFSLVVSAAKKARIMQIGLNEALGNTSVLSRGDSPH